jgi:hypothetical protein
MIARLVEEVDFKSSYSLIINCYSLITKWLLIPVEIGRLNPLIQDDRIRYGVQSDRRADGVIRK